MPSGIPSIALFLLEALGHRCDGLQRRFRLQLSGDDRGLEAFGDLAARGPVPVTMNVSPFEKFPSGHHRLELVRLDVVIVDAVTLAVARRTGGMRNREVQRDAEGLDLAADAIDEGCLARAR